ncbi:MAG: flagellar biosynthetic protein FliO [Candidatus Gastranaerophilales bacterium]
MSGYLVNFVIYTTAMVGVIFLALYVYKKVTISSGQTSKSKFLEVQESITLSPRKNLYVVKAGEEKFLIASDIESTVLISKLSETSVDLSKEACKVVEIEGEKTVLDFPKLKKQNTVFQNIINKI